jgi:hypothetical protein
MIPPSADEIVSITTTALFIAPGWRDVKVTEWRKVIDYAN